MAVRWGFRADDVFFRYKNFEFVRCARVALEAASLLAESNNWDKLEVYITYILF